MSDLKNLAVVMPVYNEEECIEKVVDAWLGILEALRIDFVMILLNDGSTDGTAGVLHRFASDPRIMLVNKPNSGHGPTIHLGYRLAVDIADWTFQSDSDSEIPPEPFLEFWERRDKFDGLFGIRVGRIQSTGRSVMSRISRIATHWLFRSQVSDVNVPYRLLRSSALRSALALIPPETFAPNILIAALFSLAGMRTLDIRVPHSNRRTGSVSLVRWRLWQGAIRSFGQLLLLRFRVTFQTRQPGSD
jgi:dolichol-phosphate mannosyltransferase